MKPLLLTLFWSLVLAKETKFKLARVLKALPGQDNKVALLEQTTFQAQDLEWSGPIKSVPLATSNILNLQNVHQSMVKKHQPDPTDRQTIVNIARLTYDAYFDTNESGWVPVPGWNVSSKFGWTNGGIRGYLFESESKEDFIIVIKGTSLATPIGSGPTAVQDKLNAGNGRRSVIAPNPKMNVQQVVSKGILISMKVITTLLKYDLSNQTIYLAVREWYPRHINVWMSGHSLGGALAGLVALTNGLPAFAYQSPGDLLYASRIGLLPRASPENLDEFLRELPIYHFGNTGDPIYLGECTGISSSCYWLTYALESKCHIGKECIFDHNGPKSVRDNGNIDMFQSVQYHSIDYAIRNVYEVSNIPTCETKSNCLATECPKWTFIE